MTTPTGAGPPKSFQSMPQMQTQGSQQNGTMPPSNPGQKYLPHQLSTAHAMSGYAMALTPRHDRVDYSMAKGGFRLWIVLFVFFMLVSGMITIFSNKKELIQVELDIEGDGELDDIEHDDDLDDAVHSETKYEQEKVDKSSPTRTLDQIPSPPEHGRRRGKTEEKKVDDDDQDHEEVHGHEHGHEHEHKHEDIDRIRTAADPKHTVGPEPPIVKLKEPLKKAFKQSIADIGEDTAEEEEEEIPRAHDEETLLQRLWEKMKKQVEKQQKQHEDTDEEKSEPVAPKRRKRGEKKVEESRSEEPEKPEPVEEPEAKPVEKPRRRTKSKPAPAEEVEEVKAEPEDQPKEPERPPRRRRTKEPQAEPEEVTPEQPEPTQETLQAAKSGRRRRTKVEQVEEKEEEKAEVEPQHEEEAKEKPSRRRKTKAPAVVEEAVPEPPAEEPPAEKPKVRVFRAKGKPKEESKPTPTPAPEPEPEPEPEQAVEEPPKPKIPVRVIRTKGRPKEDIVHLVHEDHEEQEPELPPESSPGPEILKQQIKVRYFRTKGKKPEELLQSFAERHQLAKEKRVEEEEKEEKQKIPVRVIRIKGKREEEPEPHVAGADSGEAKGKTTALRVPEYRKHLITNREDNKIRQLLDDADRLVDERRLDEALSAFDKLLKAYPRSPRAHYGKARALEQLAADKQSNTHLDACIREYETTLRLPHLTEGLQRLVTDRFVDRTRFRGWLDKAALAQSRLVDKYPSDLDLLNDLGVTYLMMGRHEDAKKIFDNVLSKDPDNGFALVHYGFILKTVDENYTFAVDYMSRGIESEEEGTQDGRFYFHLGDALQKLNRTEEAYEVYEEAAALGIFLSKYQRSLYNVAGLTARPFWTPEQTPYVKHLRAIESEWKVIRDEGLAILDQKSALFNDDDDEVAVYGSLKEFVLYSKGKRIDANCVKTPKTCAIMARFPEAAACTRGEIKFSLMEGGTRVWPHCGPTNCRLRGHLGLVVPPDSRLRVGDETKSWRQGKFLILDDSFENEVWHDGTGFRLLLVIDFWHPELSAQQRAALTPV